VSLLVITASAWKIWGVMKTTDMVYTWILMDTPTGTLVSAVTLGTSYILRDTILANIGAKVILMLITGRVILRRMPTREGWQFTMAGMRRWRSQLTSGLQWPERKDKRTSA
jgi:hypothetical protein